MSDESAPTGQRAFLSAADPSRYFPAAAAEEARRRISRCIARAEGTTLLIGGAGLGKTLLLEVLAAEFSPRMSIVPLIGAQLCTRRALLQMILFELGLPFRDMDEGELRLALHEHLKPAGKSPRRLLLLVDEADSLPMRLLEEVRALTNLSSAGAPLVSVVLAGRAILEELFADPKLDVFAQRLAARCYLSHFSRDETLSFVRSQLSAAGEDADSLMSEEALDAIHHAADGVPRLINQLGDQLMWIVEQTGCRPLDAALVQQAWSDLQQLPAPWETNVAPGHAADVIEFGELGELEDEPSMAIDCVVERLADEATPPDLDAMHEYDQIDSDADELPASISIDVARQGHRDSSLQDMSSAIDDAEALLSTLDETDPLESLPLASSDVADVSDASEDCPPDSASAVESTVAQDPFAEDFDDEEIVIDQYVRFETSILAATQSVLNFGDQALASELGGSDPAPDEREAAVRQAASNSVEDRASVIEHGDQFDCERSSERSPGEVSVDEVAELGEGFIIAADVSEMSMAPFGDVPACDIIDESSPSGEKLGRCTEQEVEPQDLAGSGKKLDAPGAPSDHDNVHDVSEADENDDEASAASLVLPAGAASELLVVEDDDSPTAEVIRSRYFRRLFSCLESGEPLNQYGAP